MQSNQERLENLLVSQDFSTFSLLEHKRVNSNDSPVGALQEESVPTGTDYDEYKQWTSQHGGISGVGDIIYDDSDDARDAAEFTRLTGVDQSITG